jgi:hypothetical protein
MTTAGIKEPHAKWYTTIRQTISFLVTFVFPTCTAFSSIKVPSITPRYRKMLGLRRGRGLPEVVQFDVQLYLNLQFLDDPAASELETLDWSNGNVIHFCNAVQAQVRPNPTDVARKSRRSRLTSVPQLARFSAQL